MCHRKAVSLLRFAIALPNSRPISCAFAPWRLCVEESENRHRSTHFGFIRCRGAVAEIRLSHVFYAFLRGGPMLNRPPWRLCVDNLMAGTGSLNCTSYFSPAWSAATFMGCNGTQKAQKGPANMNVHAGLEVCFGLA
jgi:hypothetical protein